MNKRYFLHTLTGSLLACAAAGAWAQAYPSKPIRLVVPFAAGGPADVVARELALKLGQQMNQSVVVENLGGGHGVPAMNAVVRAPADGHTLILVASGNVTIQPLTMKTSADALAKLEPVGLVSTSPHVLVVSSKLPVRNIKELVDYARANPGKLSFGSAGTGGVAHLGLEMFKSLAKVDVIHVPYKGTSQVMVDLSSGEVQGLFSSMPSLKPLVDKGTIRAVGLTAPSKASDTASLPQISATVPGMEYTTWYGLFAARGTPPAIVEKLNAELRKVVADTALRSKLSEQGVDLQTGSPAELQALTKRDSDKWGKLIRDANLQIE